MHYLRKPNVEKLQNRMIHGHLDRRQFMAATAAAGVMPATAAMTPGARAAESSMITSMTWSGYEVPELHQSFIDKHGQSPNFSIFASAEDGLQKIRAGFNPDFAHPCVEEVRRWHDMDVIAPIDPSRLTQWSDVFPALQTIEGGWIDDELFMVILDLGLSSIIYRTDIYEGEETWAMLFDERYAGRICARGTYINITIALLLLGYDIWNPTDEQLAEAGDLAREQRPLVRFYWESQTDMEQAIATGECVAAYAWNEALINLNEQGVPVAFAKPKEGAFGWACGLVRVNSGEGDEQMAYDFIDAWLAPESGKFLIENYGYGHSNAKSYDLVDESVLAMFGYDDPMALIEDTTFFATTDPEMDQKTLQLWEDIQAGL